jgi:hypothetical protein
MPTVVETRDKVETNPDEPRPATVDTNVVILVPPGPNAVEKEDKAWLMDDVKDKVETYPAVPNPATVETITGVERNPEI